ncbi:MAG: 50S ribosomal protein L32e [Thermoproteota archaeon]
MAKTEAEKLLTARRKRKMNKPEFTRQESWRYVRIKENWRRPRGKDSKMRLRIKGWPRVVRIGYRGTKEARGLHPTGLKPVMVSSKKDLEEVGPPEGKIIIFSSRMGRRLRETLAKEALARGFRIANYRRATKASEEA